MNPIKNYKKIIYEIEKAGRLEELRDLEDKIIKEIVRLVEDGSPGARLELEEIERVVNAGLDHKPKNKLLISALKNSIAGALSVAKYCLL